MNKNEKRIGTIAVLAVLIVVLFLYSKGLFSITGSCPNIPTSIYSGAYGVPGLAISGCAFTASPSGTPTSWNYSILENQQTSFAGVINLGSFVQYALISNQTVVNQVNANNQQILSTLNGTLAGYQAQLSSDESTGSCGYNGYTCTAFSIKVQETQQLIQIVQNAIAYDNSLMMATSSTTTTGTTSTTTMSGGTPPPPPPFPNIIADIGAIFTQFNSILQSIFTQYFGSSIGNLFSIAPIGNVSASNITTLGSEVTAQISLTIPQADVSNVWTPSVTTLVRTYCQAAAKYNTSASFIVNTTITNMTSTSFSVQLPVKTAQRGILIFGGACVTTNNTYNFGTGQWNGWAAYKNVTVEHYAVYVAGPQNLITSANPASGGTVVPPTGTHVYGSQIILGEQAVSGYAFIGWTGSGAGSYSGTSPTPTVTLNNNMTETANFQVSTGTPPPPPQPSLLQQISNAISSFITGIQSFFAGLGL